MRLRSKFSLIIILLFTCLSLRGQVKVSCIGDSITYGMKLENREADSYPSQLQKMLGPGYVVYNFGRNGATLLRHGHRPYMEQEEFAAAMASSADIYVIHLGVNDTDPRDWPVCGEDFVKDYLALIDTLRSVSPGARFIIARMTPIGDTHPRFLTGTKEWHTLIQKEIEKVAADSGAQLIDFYEPMYHFQWMLPDAVHPVPEGAAMLAKAAYSAITGDFGGLALPIWYGDSMVLPREKVFPIRGTADAGEKVIITLGGKKYESVAGADGKWEVTAGPFAPSTGAKLTVQAGRKKLCFKDIAFGDIWLCSGQSNMEFELKKSSSSADAVKAADPALRLFYMKCNWRTDNVSWSASAVDSVQHLQYFKDTRWEKASPETAADFSAIGYYFGKTLRDSLGVPVGLVCNATGGSTAESWIDRELLETQYPEILKDWLNNPLIMEWARGRASGNLAGGVGKRHPYEPCYLYESAILPLKDMPVTGVIWYQGESNAENIPSHEKLFPLVVDSFRGVYGEIPFYYAQLSYMERSTWPSFRDSQKRLEDCRPGLGMISTFDLGEAREVHYKNKKPAGERFAALALNRHYGKKVCFGELFRDSTLRLDYVFCGDASSQEIFLRRMVKAPVWAGRRNNLEEPLLRGNGQVRVKDPETGRCIYSNSFSSLFLEWTVTPEAAATPKAFENSLLIPLPKRPVEVEVCLFDVKGKVSARIEHPVDPADILIRPAFDGGYETEVVHKGGEPADVVDILVISEGYTVAEKEKFFRDSRRAADALFSHEPFASNRDKFAVRAAFAPSEESGVSLPREGKWLSTAVDSHFDTFYMDRYLTTASVWEIADIAGTIPYEHIIVLANTAIYGGGGVFNHLTIMNSDHPTFVPVIVHEFGHAFGGLADEYDYGSDGDSQYPAGVEPWEPNITTLADFASKWQDLVPAGTPVPTPVDEADKDPYIRRNWNNLSPQVKYELNHKIGVYEGAGYESKGVYRPVQECRMRINECEDFCPVCRRAIEKTIGFYTGTL